MMDNKERHRPPKWADDFLAWFCSGELIEETQGDLHEAFHRRCKERGVGWARLLFVADVFLSLGLRTIHSPVYSSIKSGLMFRNYFTIAWRNLFHNKMYAAISILGLAVGLAACFLLMEYVRFEKSYDQFHANADRIYRVIQEGKFGLSAASYSGVGPSLKADFPEVEEYVRMVHQSLIFGDNMAVSYEDEQGNVKMFSESRIYDVDPSFLKIFSFPFIYGDPENALQESSSIIISRSTANKFFGSENPIGKRLNIFARFPFTVNGVFEDVPENSHIKFDILMATWMRNHLLEDSEGNPDGDWKWPEFYTYIKLKPFADPSDLILKSPQFLQKYVGDRAKGLKGNEQIHLQAITDIHLRSPVMTKEREVHGSERTVYFVIVIAVMIVIIAWINYINLTTSRSIERAKEVGLRKVVGASRHSLIIQFLVESALMNFLAIVSAFILVLVAAPYFNVLSGKPISSNGVFPDGINDPQTLLSIGAVFVLGSYCTGLYPAFVLSSFKVVNAIKGKFLKSESGILVRKILVGSQFAISTALISGTLVVLQQVSFMRNQEPGYLQDQLLVIKTPLVLDTTFYKKLSVLKNELKRNPSIQEVTASNEIPGKLISQVNLVRNRDEASEGDSPLYHLYIDTDFINTYGLTILAGRNFTNEEALPSLNDLTTYPVPVIINEKVANRLGYKHAEDAINQLITYGWGARRDWTGEIVGVVSNYHQQSLKSDYDPILFFPVTRPTPHLSGQYVSINLNMSHPTETISFIENQYAKAFPGHSFEYFFLDDFFNRQYAADQQFGKVFGLFSSLALFVAALGLFGFSTFMILQRVKEIAIRKVLGATIGNIVALFSKDFVRLIIIANFIALPVVYVLANQWLDSFAFRVNIGWVVFIVPTTVLLVITLATVSIQTIKTSLANPVKSLRSE